MSAQLRCWYYTGHGLLHLHQGQDHGCVADNRNKRISDEEILSGCIGLALGKESVGSRSFVYGHVCQAIGPSEQDLSVVWPSWRGSGVAWDIKSHSSIQDLSSVLQKGDICMSGLKTEARERVLRYLLGES